MPAHLGIQAYQRWSQHSDLHHRAAGPVDRFTPTEVESVPPFPKIRPAAEPRPGEPPRLALAVLAQLEQRVAQKQISASDLKLLGEMSHSPDPTVRVLGLRTLEMARHHTVGDFLSNHQYQYGEAEGPQVFLSRRLARMERNLEEGRVRERDFKAPHRVLDHIESRSKNSPQLRRTVVHLWSAMLRRPESEVERPFLERVEGLVEGWLKTGRLKSGMDFESLRAQALKRRPLVDNDTVSPHRAAELTGAAHDYWYRTDDQRLADLPAAERTEAIEQLVKMGEVDPPSGILFLIRLGLDKETGAGDWLKPHQESLFKTLERFETLGWESQGRSMEGALAGAYTQLLEMFPERADEKFLDEVWSPLILTHRRPTDSSISKLNQLLLKKHPELRGPMMERFVRGYRESYLDERADRFLDDLLKSGYQPTPDQSRWLAGWALPLQGRDDFFSRCQQTSDNAKRLDEFCPKIRDHRLFPDAHGQPQTLSMATLSRLARAETEEAREEIEGLDGLAVMRLQVNLEDLEQMEGPAETRKLIDGVVRGASELKKLRRDTADPGFSISERAQFLRRSLELAQWDEKSKVLNQGSQALKEAVEGDPLGRVLRVESDTEAATVVARLFKLLDNQTEVGAFEANAEDLGKFLELSLDRQSDAFALFDQMKVLQAQGLPRREAWERVLKTSLVQAEPLLHEAEIEFGEDFVQIGDVALDVY